MAIAPPRTLTFASSNFEHPDAGQGLGGKGLVQFDQIDVGQLQAGSLERLLVAGTGPVPITHGSTPATAVARTRTSGFRPNSLGLSADITSMRRGAVVQRRAVAGGDGAQLRA